MDNKVVSFVKDESTNNITFRFKKDTSLYKVIYDSLSSVFPMEYKEQTEFIVPSENVITFADYSSPEDIRKQLNKFTYAFMKQLFLDIGNQCVYLQKTSGLYISELQLEHIVYIKDKFVILHPEEIMKDKSKDISEGQWMNDLANMVLSFIDNIEKLNGTSLYYAILRCQERLEPRFIYV
jgi:hypothetical protein